ncbi:uncharacterized protein A1O9_07514 [Exophiala aquamarina CBS 119918]|uniref:Major facilitator superfamily (MFS) profile domain-containing protein n=1 Tax=Exophiala aquamarina CBS 119918 TaxID=1182545 RepID=A0A072P743_9EURO|nr:uncharacterized protein A1O9_07514 [Exophiala aquamarina CBS 119918]KEF55934.1 hypothetical protein A1O9_07514 [Exophiala aquamarina CBS 119918]
MAGGTSIWFSQQAKHGPREIFNLRLLFILISVAWGTIAAMLAAGGSAGALCAAPTADFLGREWSVFLWGIVFLIGAVMQMIANYDVLIAGRFFGGLGVGATSMPAPQFLAENSPKLIRGSMTATYNLMILQSLVQARH